MFTFEFTVTNLSREQADILHRLILLYVESHGGEVGGGYGPTEAEGKDDEQKTLSDTNSDAK